MKIKVAFLILFPALLASCFPEKVKKEMAQAMKQSQEIFTDQEFKKAVAYIELHRVRYGEYPEALSDLKFLGQLDSTIFQYIQYNRLEGGYELNLLSGYYNIYGTRDSIRLNYPAEFWQGLGCVRSNLKK